jgi:hypothetical protein
MLFLLYTPMIMLKRFNLIFLLSLMFSVAYSQSNSVKPSYAGHIEYTKGNFGSYNYPAKRDSILVYLKDSTINFVVFYKEISKHRDLEISSAHFQMASKNEYNDILTINKIVATGNYDMKFIATHPGDNTYCILYLTHFGDGSTADLTLTVETGRTRLNDIFVASLVKLK